VAKDSSLTRSVVLVEHDPAWGELASRASARIVEALGEAFISIHHIGSTAIPGIRAKPILDLLIVVRDLVALDARVSGLEDLGYMGWGRPEFPAAGTLRWTQWILRTICTASRSVT